MSTVIEQHYQKALSQLSTTSIMDKFKKEDECWVRVNDTLELWKELQFFKRNNITLFSKYYIVNKKKMDCSNIQESVRSKIDDLNRIHQNNKYFFHLDQCLINNKENKHRYNNFDISLIEYESLTLSDLIINHPYLMNINLPYFYINSILDNVSSFIKSNKKKLSQIDRDNQMVHHTELISNIECVIDNKLQHLFNKSAPARLIKDYISSTSYRSSTILNLNDIFPELIDSSRKEIVNSLIALDLPFNIKWLNNFTK